MWVGRRLGRGGGPTGGEAFYAEYKDTWSSFSKHYAGTTLSFIGRMGLRQNGSTKKLYA